MPVAKRKRVRQAADDNDADTTEAALARLYYNPASTGAYGGVDRLLLEARRQNIAVTRRQVDDFLAEQETYARHRPVRHKFVRNRTYVGGIDEQWQADLAEVQHLAEANNGIRYLLTVIDVFSKYAWVLPVKSKSAPDMTEAFRQLFSKRHAGERVPLRLQTDKGKEFLCRPVQQLLLDKGIHHFSSESDMKAAVAERFNRTIKTRIWYYLTAKHTRRYVDVLPKLVAAYNRSRHRSIGMAPADVRKEHAPEIYRRLYPLPEQQTERSSKQLKPGEAVRISRWKRTFEKGYEPNWSKELFNVHRVATHLQKPMYELRDAKDEPIVGKFYADELQRVRRGEYVVERVLAERGKADGSKEVLVKWEGWPARYNSWVDKSTLRDM